MRLRYADAVRRLAPRATAFCVALAVTLSALGTVRAQDQDPYAQMRDLLAQGYYNSAARLNGPELVARYPDEAEAHFLYAHALYLTGDTTGAQASLDRALALGGGDDPDFIHLQGMLRAVQGDVEGALRALQNAYLRTRDYGYAMDWGRVAWQFARYPEALEAFDAAAGTDRGARELWPHLDRGRVLLLLDRVPEAIAAFERAIDVFEATDRGDARPGSPAYVEAYFRLGEAYERLGELGQAEVNYRAARSADPNYAPAVTALDRLSRSFE